MIILQSLGTIPAKELEEALRRIERAESIGPLLNPTAFMGDTFRKAEQWKRVLSAVLKLRHELPATPEG